MKKFFAVLLLVLSAQLVLSAPIVADISGVKPGPITVAVSGPALVVNWKDSQNRQWQAQFALDSTKPVITSISADGKDIVQSARPYYRCTTGKRTGGWDAFFDFPAGNPAGTRQFLATFHPEHAT